MFTIRMLTSNNKPIMKKLIATLCFGVMCLLSQSCTSNSDNSENNQNSESTYSSENAENNEESSSESTSDCQFEDGSHTATVNYNNPETGYSATYTLDVDVEDCQVVQINFPNDGYLDNDHISYADIDSDGNALVYGEEGKTYDIQID